MSIEIHGKFLLGRLFLSHLVATRSHLELSLSLLNLLFALCTQASYITLKENRVFIELFLLKNISQMLSEYT